MNTLRRMTIWMLVLTLTALGASAQEESPQPAGPDPDQPRAESVFQYVPADCMMFIGSNNVKDLLMQTEAFADKIGLGEMLSNAAPEGLIPMMGQLGFGEGYNPNGGAIIFLPDFDEYGYDMTNPAGPPPMGILLAGKSAMEIFPQTAMEDEEGNVMVSTPMGMLYTHQMGDYVMFSNNQQLLQSATSAEKVSAALSDKYAGLMKDNDLCVWADMPMLAGLLEKVAQQTENRIQQMREEYGCESEEMKMQVGVMRTYADILKQMDMIAMGMKYVDDGITMDILEEIKPDTDLARQLEGTKTTTAALLDKLPSQPYVIAGGQVFPAESGWESMVFVMNMLDQLFAMGEMEISADLRERMIDLGAKLYDQTESMQFVGGGSQGPGYFGLSCVVNCKDADKVMSLMPEKAKLINELIQTTLGKMDDDFTELQVVYQTGVEEAAGMNVDAMEITHPEMATMEERERSEMTKVLGEDKVRFFVTKVDDKTVVATFGGGTTFLADAIGAAKTGGPLSEDPNIQKALAHLPKDRVGEFVFSPKNLFDIIEAVMMQEGEPMPEGLEFTCPIPISMGATIDGMTVHGKMFIPTGVAKDVTNMIMLFNAPSESDPVMTGEGNF